jgi:hypothetical protein
VLISGRVCAVRDVLCTGRSDGHAAGGDPDPDDHAAWEQIAQLKLATEPDMTPNRKEIGRRKTILLALRAQDRDHDEATKVAARRLVSQSDLTGELLEMLNHSQRGLDAWYQVLVRKDMWGAFNCQSHAHSTSITPPQHIPCISLAPPFHPPPSSRSQSTAALLSCLPPVAPPQGTSS